MARLIDRILAQDSITTVCPITKERKPRSTVGLRSAIRVEADEVGHLFWANEKDYWDQRDQKIWAVIEECREWRKGAQDGQSPRAGNDPQAE